MALVLKKLYHGYFWISRDLADPRTDGIFLLSTPLIPILISLTYIYFVYHIGPKLMENRKPFNITKIIRLYNVVQVVLNTYLTIYVIKILNFIDWDRGAIDYTDNSNARLVIHLGYIYYLLKILDLMDTIFFILRKSYRQISFLHVYHHSIMVFSIFIGCRYVPGGASVWIPAFNSFVHAVLYTYYLMATIDDKWKDVKYKKTLTQLQLLQFMGFLFIFGRLLLKSDSEYPKLICYMFVPQNLFMVILFSDFYVKTYVHKKINK